MQKDKYYIKFKDDFAEIQFDGIEAKYNLKDEEITAIDEDGNPYLLSLKEVDFINSILEKRNIIRAKALALIKKLEYLEGEINGEASRLISELNPETDEDLINAVSEINKLDIYSINEDILKKIKSLYGHKNKIA